VSVDTKDTAAWHVIEQILKHTWGPGEDLDDEEILSACKMFWRAGGVWKTLMEGDPKHVGILEECINNVIHARKLTKIALKISGKV
jgi:hypothetical protein